MACFAGKRDTFVAGQDGVVLITVLWVIIFMSMLAASIVGGIRLSALAAYHFQQAGGRLADTMSAVEMAKMELMLIRMPEPVGVGQKKMKRKDSEQEQKKEAYRMNGHDLTLYYPQPESVGVRIWDHAGKINLRRLTVARMRELLLKLLPKKSDAVLDSLINSWLDWVDTDDLKRIGGAEKQYYQSLTPPLSPRNGPLETVDELLLIKGFAKLFANIDVHDVFTVYGMTSQVNFNLASRNVLLLIPGLDEKDVDAILRFRDKQEIRSAKDIAPYIPPDHLAKAIPWMSFVTSNYYTIGVYDKEVNASTAADHGAQAGSPDAGARWGYAEIVRARGFNKIPETLEVMPMVLLPGYPPEQKNEAGQDSGHFFL